MLLVLLGGALSLAWQSQQAAITHADASTIVGPPSLPAATVETILKRLGSPMAGNGQVIEQAARDTNIDDAFALAVWWTETNDGAAGVGAGYHNPGGVRGSGAYAIGGGGYTIYPTYADGITDWFNIVKSRYINRGLTTVYTLCTPYVGTSSAYSWADKVVNNMSRYRSEAPPPTPTPTPTPFPDTYQRNHVLIDASTDSLKVRPDTYQEPAPQASLQTTKTSTGQNAMVLLALLIALVVAGLGYNVRKQLPVSIPRSVQAPDILQQKNSTLQPLYVNEYSPLSSPKSPKPLLAGLHEPDSLLPLSQPSVPQRPGLTPTGTGLLSRYGQRPRRIVLTSSTEPGKEEGSFSQVELSHAGEASRPARALGRGLLQQFGDIDEKPGQKLLTK
ncbi:hypothetical protein KTT_03040 [Tengunoibacter tsumagoiensis]|uniref:Uncharacterized protein n=2 Tax=Tengunoibacter tsumagoiensis TaxID=2014871 RepID=A0A401ZU68_9CHLR|nr:hypothetical protein KTT_03040 [Tengunoibacter tsumagoiensis]